MLIILIYRAFLSVSRVRARVEINDQSELFHKIDLRKFLLLTRLERVRVGVNNAQIWCVSVSARVNVLHSDQSEPFHKIIQRKEIFLHN